MSTEKLLFQISAGLLLTGASFGAGLYSAASENAIYRAIKSSVQSVQLVFQERETVLSIEPAHYLQPARHEGSGVTTNTGPENDDLILLSGFMEGNTEIRLITRDGTIRQRWPVPYSTFFPTPEDFVEVPPATDWNKDLHGMVINPDGSLVFNFEYGGTVKLDRCGAIDWTVEHPTHHSLEHAETGGYWTLGRHYHNAATDRQFPPLTDRGDMEIFLEDLIILLDEEGKIVLQKSIPAILYDNGYEALMSATGERTKSKGGLDRELVHSNKLAELPAALAQAFPNFEAGDLMLSLRGYNMVFVVDPDTWEIKWLKVGPWLRQHDPEFTPDGTILVYNNNTYYTHRSPRGRRIVEGELLSNIIEVNPGTDETRVVYGDTAEQAFHSTIRGKHDLTPAGGLIITEFEAGRVFEVDAQGNLIWEYINRYDEARVLEMTEGRIYPASYFTVTDWSCP